MKVIGVDLGTTNSCVYYLDEEGNPVLLLDRKENRIFPSAVWRAGADKEIVVGHKAKARIGHRPPPIIAVKRLMGTNRTVNLGGEQVTPVEVSAHTLTYAKRLVEEMTGDEVGGVVVTIPAYFDTAPKQDTRAAAVEAFFGGDKEAAEGRLELLLEPEAAAYAYTIEDPRERLRVLVYDLGGGTFDVTILEKSPEAGLVMLKFGGDPHLGGDNFDDRLAAFLLYLLRGGKPDVLDRILAPGRYDDDRRYTILQQVLTNDTRQLRGELHPEDRDLLIGPEPRFALDLDPDDPEDMLRTQKLKGLAEKAKIDMTLSTEVVIAHQGAFEDQEGSVVDIDFTLGRSDFNRLVGDFIEKTVRETFRTIKEAGLTADQIDQVVLVGGSTRMPVVAEELAKVFDCPIQMRDPDLIVARGAALRGRDLNPPPPGDSPLTLEYPRQTPDAEITVMGHLSQSLDGFDVFVSRDGEELATAPVNGDSFIVPGVRLVPNAENRLRLEVADQDDHIFAEAEITVRHDAGVLAPPGPLTTPLTKPIRYLGTRGFKTLFAEGDMLPAEKTYACYRATQDDFIKIPLYEGERWLADLHLPGVDPALPLNSKIDLHLVIHKDYTVSATATVSATGQAQSVEFQISRIEIPDLDEMDRDLEAVMEQFDNDIESVRDRNERARLSRKARNLEGEYRKARKELTIDPHKLYTLIGELKKVLIEVAGAQVFLEPPLETFEQFIAYARGLAQQLKDESKMTSQEVLAKISALERTGKDAWGREDAPLWRQVNSELEKFSEDLESEVRRQSRGGDDAPPKISPEEIQRQMHRWLDELRAHAAEHGLEGQFRGELEHVVAATRNVDLRNEDQARKALVEIVEDQLRPLDNKIKNEIRRCAPPQTQGGSTTVE